MIEKFLFAPTVTIAKPKTKKVEDGNPFLTVIGLSENSTVKGQIRLNSTASKLTGIGHKNYMTVITNKAAVLKAIEDKAEITVDGGTRIIKKKDLDAFTKVWIAIGFPKRDEEGNIPQRIRKTSKEQKEVWAKQQGLKLDDLTKSKLPREDDMIGMLMASPNSKNEIGAIGSSLLGSGSKEGYWQILKGDTTSNNLIYSIAKTPITHNLGIYGDIEIWEVTFEKEEEKQVRTKK